MGDDETQSYPTKIPCYCDKSVANSETYDSFSDESPSVRIIVRVGEYQVFDNIYL